MNQSNPDFNRDAARLVPSDMPASFPVHVEQCEFALPDFSDVRNREAADVDANSAARWPKPAADGASIPAELGAGRRKPGQPDCGVAPRAEPAREAGVDLAADRLSGLPGPLNVAELWDIDRVFAAGEPVAPHFTTNPSGTASVPPEIGAAGAAEVSEPHFQPVAGVATPFDPMDSEFLPAPGSSSRPTDEVAAQPELPGGDRSGNDQKEKAQFEQLTFRATSPADGDSASHPATRKPVLLMPRIAECRMNSGGLIRNLVQKRATGRANVCLFCEVDTPLRAGQVALAVARELALASRERVLIVDSDLERGSLSARLRLEDEPGTRELMRAMYPWQRLVLATDVQDVSLLPIGKQRLRFSGPSAFVEGVCRNSLQEISEIFGHVLVTTGTAFDNSLHVWRWLCDGTVLVLDADHSSRAIAQTAVRELNNSGCRVIGCLPAMASFRTGAAERIDAGTPAGERRVA